MKLKQPHRAAEWFLSGASVDISRVTRNLTFCSIPSKHAGSDWHPVRIGWEALARSVPDDYCTPVFLVHTRISDRSWSERDRTVNNIYDHAAYVMPRTTPLSVVHHPIRADPGDGGLSTRVLPSLGLC